QTVSSSTPTPRAANTPAPLTPTPAASPTFPAGMTAIAGAQSLVLTSTRFYWVMRIPRDWVSTENTGFEFAARDPQQRAFVHLLSQTWLTKDRKLNAQAYIDYWKTFKYGN